MICCWAFVFVSAVTALCLPPVCFESEGGLWRETQNESNIFSLSFSSLFVFFYNFFKGLRG